MDRYTKGSVRIIRDGGPIAFRSVGLFQEMSYVVTPAWLDIAPTFPIPWGLKTDAFATRMHNQSRLALPPRIVASKTLIQYICAVHYCSRRSKRLSDMDISQARSFIDIFITIAKSWALKVTQQCI